jgi:hypothetical protein
MKDLHEELEAIDTKENHLKTLDTLLIVYLSSEEANNHKERVDTLMLLCALRRLFI